MRRTQVGTLEQRGDFAALSRLLSSPDARTGWKAAEALGKAGPAAVPFLLEAIRRRDAIGRIGAAEALSQAGGTSAVPALAGLLGADPRPEVRFAAALAVGTAGGKGALPLLVASLRDRDRLVRYGAALALEQNGHVPSGGPDFATYLVAKGAYADAAAMGPKVSGAADPLLADPDPAVRAEGVSFVAATGGPGGTERCVHALRDADAAVRWGAVTASGACGVPRLMQPLLVRARAMTGQNPRVAALLNLLFPGIGYNYLGYWWGFLLFQINLTLLLLISLATGPLLPQAVSYCFSAVFALHAYLIASERREQLWGAVP